MNNITKTVLASTLVAACLAVAPASQASSPAGVILGQTQFGGNGQTSGTICATTKNTACASAAISEATNGYAYTYTYYVSGGTAQNSVSLYCNAIFHAYVSGPDTGTFHISYCPVGQSGTASIHYVWAS